MTLEISNSRSPIANDFIKCLTHDVAGTVTPEALAAMLCEAFRTHQIIHVAKEFGCELPQGSFAIQFARYIVTAVMDLPHYPTAIAAAEAFRAEHGDSFATASEMEMLKDEPDYLREVLADHGRVYIVDEYAAQEKADADRLAAETAEANVAATCPVGFVQVDNGPILAGDYVWNRADGGFEIYNVDGPDLMRAEHCFLVCREVKF